MSISLSESAAQVGKMRHILKGHSPVVSVVSQLGRPDDGTDVAGFNNVELFAPLEPFDKRPHGLTKDKLVEQIAGEFAGGRPGGGGGGARGGAGGGGGAGAGGGGGN